MSVTSIIPSIDSRNSSVKKVKQNIAQINSSSSTIPQVQPSAQANKNVSFQGAGGLIGNSVVGLMDFIEAGGYAASFIIQDGLGFVAPRVGGGLVRGGKEKRDENGNVILDKNGNPKHDLNWAFARKEALREVITGPSAFVIPYFMLNAIKKYSGAGNNIQLDYIDGLKAPFTKFVSENTNSVMAGTADKGKFYHEVLKDVITKTVNDNLPQNEKMSAKEIDTLAKDLADKQIKIENILSDKTLNKKAKANAITEIGGSVEDAFMKLKKGKIGGAVNEMAVNFNSSTGKVKTGSISNLLGAMNDYFDDAVKNVKKSLKDNTSAEQIENAVRSFTHRRMGTRILTNLGLFGAVALFYTQIPKLYNMGLKGNPALAGNDEASSNIKNAGSGVAKDSVQNNDKSKVAFTGMSSKLESFGETIFNGGISKKVSDIFELHGPVISGSAMPVLLYGFCIPPRLEHAQDKYDYGEIVVRDMTAFTALLFGAKALARLFSDGFTRITGLALNQKNMEGKGLLKRIGGYLNPQDTSHSVLSSKQLNSKYTNIHEYKNGVSGFMEFIEQSGGNIKRAFAQDKQIQNAVEEILKNVNGKTFKDASVSEIKDALRLAHKNEDKLIKNLYKLFESSENGLLKTAKTCNSMFGFLSTIVLVPGLIMWLTHVCEKMTNKRTAKDKAAAQSKNIADLNLVSNKLVTNKPSMAGFLGATATK